MPRPVTPAVSVVLPTCNRPDMLSRALESVAQQTFHDYEVIVVNDAGTDVSAVVERFARRVTVRLITHERGRGVAAARNTGVTAACGKYIAYLDDDDYYFENHLAILYSFLCHDKRRFAYTDARQDIQELHDGVYKTVKTNMPYSADFSPERIYADNITPTLCVMHDRECIARSGLFAEYLRAHEDWDLWLRMARHYEFKRIPKTTCAFTTRVDNTSLSTAKKDLMRDTWIYTRLHGILAERMLPVNSLEEAARQVARLGPEDPEPCKVSIVLPLSMVSEQTPRDLAALCSVVGDAQLILAGSGIERARFEPIYRALAGTLPRAPLALCNPGEIGRIFAANQGAAAATGEWLIFLEEDVRPQPGWLDALLRSASEQPALGVLGGVLHAPGLAPLAGGRLDADGTPVFMQATDSVFRQTQLVSGHCLMVRRETFIASRGFDPAFAPAHYADADLCLRLARQNRICGIAPDASLIWNKNAHPLQQSPAGLFSLRIFQDRWAPNARIAALNMAGADWSRRPRLWLSEGTMPKNFTLLIPQQLIS